MNNLKYKYKVEKYKSKINSLLGGSKYSKIKNCKINKKYKKELNPIYLGGALPKKMKTIHKFKKITICTYNIWSNEKFAMFSKLEKRLPYIIDEIIKDDPDIICIQEMSQQAIDYFKSRKEIYTNYFFFEIDLKKNDKSSDIPFILSKYKPRNVTKYMLETESINWPFLIMEFTNLIVVNVQLQGGSENSNEMNSFTKCRIQQLSDINEILKNYTQNIIFVGDINFNPDTDIEKDQLNKLLLTDAWKKLKSNDDGFTEDTTLNKMRWNTKHVRNRGRYDVILYRGNRIKPIKIRMIGVQPIFTIDKNDVDFNKHIDKNKLDKRFIKLTDDRIQYWPSDRFGLIADFII